MSNYVSNLLQQLSVYIASAKQQRIETTKTTTMFDECKTLSPILVVYVDEIGNTKYLNTSGIN